MFLIWLRTFFVSVRSRIKKFLKKFNVDEKKKLKVKDRFKRILMKAKTNLQFIKRIVELKYAVAIFNIKSILRMLVNILFVSAAIFGFCYLVGIIKYQSIGFVLDLHPAFNSTFNIADLVVTQTSMTLLIVSLIAILPSISDKKILGRKALDVVFPVFSRVLMQAFNVLLFLCMFLNIGLALRNSASSYIIMVFIFSSILLMLLIFEISSVFLNSKRVKKRLVIKGYRENINYIKKTHPLESSKNDELDMLVKTTLEHIRINNPDYYENVDTLAQISELTLYNNSEILQGLYTEMFDNRDALSQLVNVGKALLKEDKIIEAANIANLFLRKLYYYEVIAISNYNLNHLLSSIIEKMHCIKDSAIFTELTNTIWDCIRLVKWQVYLYTKTDLSWCRLGKLDMLNYFPPSYFLADFYNSFQENSYLTIVEKDRILETLFHSIYDYEADEKIPPQTNRDFKARKQWNLNPEPIPAIIKAEPLALLYLAIIENSDLKALQTFRLSIYSEELQFFVKVLVSLSVFSLVLNQNKRRYYLDLKIEPKAALNVLQSMNKTSRVGLPKNIEYIVESYANIISFYSISGVESRKGSIYGFHPRLHYKREVVDSYFKLLFGPFKEEFSCFLSGVGDSFLPNDTIVFQLQAMQENVWNSSI